jgi:galactitol-specific phosphotransferase system IIB component
LTILKPQRNIKKDLEKVGKIYSLVDKRLKSTEKFNQKVENLTIDELNDLSEILRLADLILTKHEVKKEFHDLLKEFVVIITKSADSVEVLDDEISELIISAEGTISRVKALRGKVSDEFDFGMGKTNARREQIIANNCSNNLTKSSTGVYTQGYPQGYLQKSTLEAEQVI